MTAPEFTISAAQLDAAGRDYHFVLRPSWVRGSLEGHEATASEEEGTLDLRASKSGSDVVVHGRLKAKLTAPCARCLEPATIRVDETVTALFVPAATLESEKAEGEHELTSAEADMLPFDGETVVLDDLVHDELVLATPMIPLCSEDCPGMSEHSAHPGGEEERAAIDPRLAPLLRFKKMHKE